MHVSAGPCLSLPACLGFEFPFCLHKALPWVQSLTGLQAVHAHGCSVIQKRWYGWEMPVNKAILKGDITAPREALRWTSPLTQWTCTGFHAQGNLQPLLSQKGDKVRRILLDGHPFLQHSSDETRRYKLFRQFRDRVPSSCPWPERVWFCPGQGPEIP